jgi:hypothetical protein
MPQSLWNWIYQYPTVSSNDEHSLAKDLLAGDPFRPVALPISIHSVQLALCYEGCSLAKRYQYSAYVFNLPGRVKKHFEIPAGRRLPSLEREFAQWYL